VDSEFITWLSAFSGTVLRICGTLFVLVNALAIGAFMLKRDRSLVQRWTSPWLAANLLLIGAGAGLPLMAGIVKAAVAAISGGSAIEASQPLATRTHVQEVPK
jgi:hypothetical protein